MILKITRFKNIPDGTIGRFELFKDAQSPDTSAITTQGDNKAPENKASATQTEKGAILTGYTLEPMGDDTTARGKDRRIPQGIYSIKWHQSPRFKMRLPLLFNDYVPPDRYILIHAGNYPDHTEGCILVGESYNDKGVYNSRAMLNRLLALMHRQELKVEIKNQIGKDDDRAV